MSDDTLNPSIAVRAKTGDDGTQLSASAQSVWAKTGAVDGEWMPLYQHMRDTAAVGGWLWDNWLPPATTRLLSVGTTARLARQRFLWLCAVHDIGKATPPFAGNNEAGRARMESAGVVFTTVPNREEMWHSVGSHLLLSKWLEEAGWSPDAAETYAVVPGSHHGMTPDYDELDRADSRPRLTGTHPTWAKIQEELLRFAADVADLTNDDLDELASAPLTVQQQVIATSVLIMADWLASDTDRFPLDGHSAERSAAGVATLNLPYPWVPCADATTADELYSSRFGAHVMPRPVQRDGLELVKQMTEPGLVIVEAPMGEGKTELGFAMAETLAAKFGFGGIFVALPTMATSNAMYTRFARFLRSAAGGVNTLHLAHSKRELNEDFTDLSRISRIGHIGDQNGGDLAAHEWLQGNGKLGVLSSFVVGTIDQVLVSALQSKHLMLRHLAMANKVVIIDEVHAVDAYMSVYLDRTLRWLGSYNIPVILMSATLPEDRRAAMLEAYKPKSTQNMPEVVGYPVTTTVSSAGVTTVASEKSGRSSIVQIQRLGTSAEAVVAQLRSSLANGGVAAVIRNTVASAQATARAIRTGMPDCEVVLSHSRFAALDRAGIDKDLVDRLGEGALNRPQKIVVVGTQVLEQSLDVDFDVMITDLAPVDLVLQRIGRLHRHDRPTRPAGLGTPVCFIAGLPAEGSEDQVDETSAYIYSLRPLLRSAMVLNKVMSKGINLPEDIPKLVAEAYSPATPEMGETVAVAETQWAERIREQEAKARGFLLGLPGQNMIDWLQRDAGDADDETGAGARQVRDIEDSLEVVLLVRAADGSIRTLPGLPVGRDGATRSGVLVPVDHTPKLSIRNTIKQSSVRMPAALSRKRTADELVSAAPPAWQAERSPMRSLVPLILSEDLTATVSGKRIRYSSDDGLIVLK